jgi:hypothetical protein
MPPNDRKSRPFLQDMRIDKRGRVRRARRTAPAVTAPIRIDAIEPRTYVRITLGVGTISEANAASHEYWRKRQARAKGHRAIAAAAIAQARSEGMGAILPAVITITRIATRTLDDDNLSSSAKHLRDGVADALGIDDGDPCVTWQYAQERGSLGVRIEIRYRSIEIEDLLRRHARERKAVGL